MTSAEDSLARKRFFAITMIRIMGALFVMIGFVLIRGGWELAGQPTDRWIGIVFVLVGAFDFAVMPKLLARRWRSPREL